MCTCRGCYFLIITVGLRQLYQSSFAVELEAFEQRPILSVLSYGDCIVRCGTAAQSVAVKCEREVGSYDLRDALSAVLKVLNINVRFVL